MLLLFFLFGLLYLLFLLLLPEHLDPIHYFVKVKIIFFEVLDGLSLREVKHVHQGIHHLPLVYFL